MREWIKTLRDHVAVRRAVNRFLAREVDITGLKRHLARQWPSNRSMLLADVEILLAEYDYGHRSEDELRHELRLIL